jgi:hypothetical protein
VEVTTVDMFTTKGVCMRPGGGKAKGSKFERKVCKALSLWVTKGKRGDVFWRSAMSGGRATVHGKKVRQAGDICAVAPEGHKLTDDFIIECKHLREINLAPFIIEDTGTLARIWAKLKAQCRIHEKHPMLIVRKNGTNTIVITELGYQRNVRCTIPHRRLEIGLFEHLIKQSPPKELVLNETLHSELLGL